MLSKFTQGKKYKKKSPMAMRGIMTFASQVMGTKDVRVDPKLNEAVWSKGIKNPPRRIRVRFERELAGHVSVSSLLERTDGDELV